MASLLARCVASNMLRVRTSASSSRFFSTKGYEFAVHDTKYECIRKFDDRLSAVLGARNGGFSPHVSPAENLASLLHCSDMRMGFFYGTHVFPRWSVVEDDKGLYILKDELAKDIEDVRESVREFMNISHEENINVPVPVVSEEEYLSANVKKNFDKYDPKWNLLPIIEFLRGNEYAPPGDYYFHVMKDGKEVDRFSESLWGSPDIDKGLIQVIAVPHKPQAVYILVASWDAETRNPYGGYAMEIILDDSLYSVLDMKTDSTDVKIFIPKKKVEGTKSIGGNLIFFQEKKFFKPTPWRPT